MTTTPISPAASQQATVDATPAVDHRMTRAGLRAALPSDRPGLVYVEELGDYANLIIDWLPVDWRCRCAGRGP
jgi:hypothetical protein